MHMIRDVEYCIAVSHKPTLRIYLRATLVALEKSSQIARLMGSTWGPPGSCRPQVGPMLAPWILLSGIWLTPCCGATMSHAILPKAISPTQITIKRNKHIVLAILYFICVCYTWCFPYTVRTVLCITLNVPEDHLLLPTYDKHPKSCNHIFRMHLTFLGISCPNSMWIWRNHKFPAKECQPHICAGISSLSCISSLTCDILSPFSDPWWRHTLTAKFIGQTLDLHGADRTQVGPILAP